MSITETEFGLTGDRIVHRYEMCNRHGTTAAVLTLGATLQSVRTYGRNGLDEITLSYDDVDRYLDPDFPYFGSVIGRVANRIAGGAFELEGTHYQLACNSGDLHLHGGIIGFDRRIWHAITHENQDGDHITLRYRSPHGEEGYPGELNVQAVYRLTEHDELTIALQAYTDSPTIVNLTNHTYWNLSGAGNGTVDRHNLLLHCAQVLERGIDGLPTGTILPVSGTAFDFTVQRPIGELINQAEGYDHCFVIDGAPHQLRTVAHVHEPDSGRVMEIATTQPGVQFYTSEFLKPTKGVGGRMFNRRGALCLETQHFPDSVHQPHFPSIVLRPGQTYQHHTVHRFSVS